MTYRIDCTNINKHWKDDFYFCEEKIISSMTEFYGRRHELMFCRTMNFSYKSYASDKHTSIGRQIGVRYADEMYFLKKYHGISTQCIDISDTKYSAIDIYNLCKKNIELGIPVAVGLNSVSSVWEIKPGEEELEFLPFLVIGVNEDHSLELVNVHELGITFSISREKFLCSYLWYTSFSVENVNEKIDLKEILEEICKNQKIDNPLNVGCNEIIRECPNISKNKEKPTYDETHDSYSEMMDLADDILNMNLGMEVGGLESVLFAPFYFDLLALYRSRLVFTKSLKYLNDYFDFGIFDGIIRKLLVASSKWNYIRMLFSRSYHDKNLSQLTKIKMSNSIKEIAAYELEINSELNELLQKCRSGDLNEANMHRSITLQSPADFEDLSQVYLVDLSKDFNHRLFSKEFANDSKSIVDRYYYDGSVSFGTIFNDKSDCFIFPKPNSLGDSIVCVGQQLKVETGEYSYITFIGSALYNEMVYDYITLNYSDGFQENICLGFNGWKSNEYEIDASKNVIWHGDVRKRKTANKSETTREAKLYSKRFSLLHEKKIKSITLPENPFICIVAITFERR